MGGILECDGVFQVPVSDGWRITGEPGRAYDLSHERLEVGVNISVYDRVAVGDDLAALLVRFAESAGAPSAVAPRVLPPERDHSRAFVRFDRRGTHLARRFALPGGQGRACQQQLSGR